MAGTRSSLRFSSAAMALLLVSVTVNLLQARRIHALVDPQPVTHLVGHAAAPITAVSLAGQPVTIGFGTGTPTLVYYFSPSCSACERNWNNVRALATSVGDRVRVVAVTADPAKNLGVFVHEHGLTFEVYGSLSRETREALGLYGTPQTVVVSSQGLISAAWTGAYAGRVTTQIEQMFHVVLPGWGVPRAAAASPH